MKFTNICCQDRVTIFTHQDLEIRGFFECSIIVDQYTMQVLSPTNQVHLFLLLLGTVIMFLEN